MRGTAAVKCMLLSINFKESMDSVTHIVNVHHGQVGPSYPILYTLVLSHRFSAVRNVEF